MRRAPRGKFASIEAAPFSGSAIRLSTLCWLWAEKVRPQPTDARNVDQLLFEIVRQVVI